MDTGGFTALFSIAASAMGIAYVVQASVTGYASVIREHFAIPEDRKIQTAISFGYASTEHPANNFRTDRAGVEEVLSILN